MGARVAVIHLSTVLAVAVASLSMIPLASVAQEMPIIADVLSDGVGIFRQSPAISGASSWDLDANGGGFGLSGKATHGPKAGWAKTLGGSGEDWINSFRQTRDKGFVLTGYTPSNNGDQDVLVLRLDRRGTPLWQKTFGGDSDDQGYSIRQTRDGGFVLTAYTESFGAVYSDILVLRLNRRGDVVWQKIFGGSSWDYGNWIEQTKDGGFILTGFTASWTGTYDVLLLRLDRNGNPLWQRTLGGLLKDHGQSIRETRDGGFILTGDTESFGVGKTDVLVVRLDADGQILWQKTFGGPEDDFGVCIAEVRDGGFILAGHGRSFTAGDWDILILRLDPQGNVLWQRTFGGTLSDLSMWIMEASDGSFVFTGRVSSFVGGAYDVLVLRFDAIGHLIWQKAFGGPMKDWGFAIDETNDGGFVLMGNTQSFGAGDWDILVLKLDANGAIRDCAPLQDLTEAAETPSVLTTDTSLDVTEAAFSIRVVLTGRSVNALGESRLCGSARQR